MKRILVSFFILFILLIVAIILNVNIGSVEISPVKIFKIIFLENYREIKEADIILKIRLPRMLLAGILGGGLSVSGFLLQTFFRNPIAGPFILGISSGAKMAVGFLMLVMIDRIGNISLSLSIIGAFVGSMIATGFVLIFAKRVKSMSTLLIIGIMIGYICSAVTDFFITFANEEEIANLTYWAMGNFSGANWEMVSISTVIILSTLLITICFAKPIGAYALGENYAASLGVNIRVFRIILISLSSILSSTVTAIAGPISFVGIAVPHISKLTFKTSKPLIIIPATFFCGAIFCLYCDLIARTLFSPAQLNISTVTSIFGAPIVIWQMTSKNKLGNVN
ncbi:MAG: iron ABC transporter permease [Candidatus Epulonipiscioides saccharophilum]|nr:MAG: iron ABC transporter permease [Epulopiscium sp. AS2M-Bin001]